MAVSDGARKWWHLDLDILDRNMSVLKVLTTIDTSNVNTNGDPNIVARLPDCSSSVSIPPRAWDSEESPGVFIVRPDIEQLELAFKNVSSYAEVINIDNRRIFRYDLRAAYNIFDFNCTALVPTDMDPEAFDTLIENEKSIVFRIAEMEFIEDIGCCDIDEIAIPDPLTAPSSLNDCSRLWYIVDEGDNSHLYSFDTNESVSSAVVDRGSINWPFSNGTEFLEYHDLAWDNRNFLWGLETDGITRLLVGDSSTAAYAMNYAEIDNPFSQVQDLFPIVYPEEQGFGAMTFNQQNSRMYIHVNRRLWELQIENDAAWKVSQISYEFGENERLGDMAFGPDGKCYCFHNNKLATIAYKDGGELPFGFITYVSDGGEYSDFVGLDFVVDNDNPSEAILYGVKTTGQLYLIDMETANKSLYSGATLGDVAVGVSSCQSGEDLRTLPFPFFPGRSPWLFIVSTSSSMSGQKLERIRTTLSDFITSYVRLGDELSIMSYADGFQIFGPRDMQNVNDAEDAIEFIEGLIAGGSPEFCDAFTEAGNPVVFHDLRSIVVISDGQFSGCGATQSAINSTLSNLWADIQTNNSNVVLYSVGIFPEVEDTLRYLGQIGGGGYVRWS